MIPRLTAIVVAWVRSLAPNLERMLLTRLFTDSSVVDNGEDLEAAAEPWNREEDRVGR
jgi:hypothetical protein